MQPAFRRIAKDVIDDINDGTLQPGDKLPSTTDLCEEYEVSTTVVHQAMMILATLGYIVGRPGLGRYVTGDNK